MTLSNFDWTDKTSVRWYILLPTGHEGPYDLLSVRRRCQQGQINKDVQVWAEGLVSPVTLGQALIQAENRAPVPTPVFEAPAKPAEEPKKGAGSLAHRLAEQMSAEAEIPPVPFDVIPPVPTPRQETVEVKKLPATPKTSLSSKAPYLLGALLVSGLFSFFCYQWIRGEENFEIHRYPKMNLALQQRIMDDHGFKGWGEKIFFKEYVPADLSHIWFVTSSFQNCQVEASFQSIDGKMISIKDEPIAYKTKGQLSKHVVEFSTFDFRSGNKIVPGMYEVDIKATECAWDSTAASIANIIHPVEDEYMARMKVVLFPKGATEYNEVLAGLLKKKEEKVLKEQGQEQLFWQDLQQKFQTLLAMSLQIEQHFLDFLERDPKKFKQNLNPTVDVYTRKFGDFLTNFVISNENYFKELGDLKERSKKRNYGVMVNTTSKRIGLEAMKYIEEMQKLKSPNKSTLSSVESRLKKTFAALKEEINQKIILISEDRPY